MLAHQKALYNVDIERFGGLAGKSDDDGLFSLAGFAFRPSNK